MGAYTGEVVQAGAGSPGEPQAKPYTGAVIPLSKAGAAPTAQGTTPGGAATGRTQVPAPRAPLEDSALAFTGGNLAKGVGMFAGTLPDTAQNITNLGRMGGDAFMRLFGRGNPNWQPLEGTPGTGQSNIEMMRRTGIIDERAEPTSTGGRYAANALQMAPNALLGRPTMQQLPKAIGAAATSGLGGEAAADIGGEEWRGVGAMLPGGVKDIRRGVAEDVFRMKPESQAAERALQQRQTDVFAKSKAAGIPIPPRDLKVDKNQLRVQDIGNKDLRQPEGSEFSPQILKAYTKQMYADGYEPLEKGMPALIPNKRFQDTIKAMAQQEKPPQGQLPQTFKTNREVLKLLGDYQQGTTMEPKVALRAIKKMRDDASANFASDKPEKVALAKTQKGIANSLEQLIDDNLSASGNQELLGKYREARTMIAKAHDYMDALQPGSRISPQVFAQKQAAGEPLSGGAKTIADIAGEFPSAAPSKNPQDESYFTHKVTPMAMTHPPAAALHWTTRMWDPFTKSAPYQNFMVDPASRLTPMQQQLIRYFSSAQQSNKGIPTPPQ